MSRKQSHHRIVVIGTGYVGLPAAIMWARAGLDVVGVDINENLVRAINDRTLLVDEQGLKELVLDPVVQSHLSASTEPCEGDVFVIAVPTPVDPIRKVADLTYVQAAIKSICPVLRSGNLVVVESTVPPLTCRDLVRPMLEHGTGLQVPEDVMLAHCPERILPGDIFQEIVHNERLIGGLDATSTAAASDLYGAFVQGALHRTDDLTAELSKLMENTYRDVNIALANELAQICETLGASAHQVFWYANRHPRVNILQPGIGVGGHCIPVDPWFLKEAAPYASRLISTARLINDEMPARTASLIRRTVADVAEPTIVALGATYKRDCEDQRESPAKEVVRLLRQDGYDVRHYDPLVPGLRSEPLASVVEGADLVVVLVGHRLILKELASLEPLTTALRVRGRLLVLDAGVRETFEEARD